VVEGETPRRPDRRLSDALETLGPTGQRQDRELRRSVSVRELLSVADDSVIDRDEVVSLLFNVSDIAVSLGNIERLLAGENDGEEEADEG
jgi:hypothetical protein